MGIIPRSVHTIFEQLESLQADYTVRVSFLELYNEELAVRYSIRALHKH
jgi:kinesin family member 11